MSNDKDRLSKWCRLLKDSKKRGSLKELLRDIEKKNAKHSVHHNSETSLVD